MKHTVFSLITMLLMQLSVSTAQAQNIVTPDVAKGVTIYPQTNIDTNGNMVVCTKSNKMSTDTCSQWSRLETSVPTGKTFVGFRVSGYRSGYNGVIEVYWK